MPSPFSDWANRLIIGPRQAVTQAMAEEAESARERRRLANQETNQWLDLSTIPEDERERRYGTRQPRVLRSEAPTLATIAGNARERRETEDRERTEGAKRLQGLLGILTPKPAPPALGVMQGSEGNVPVEVPMRPTPPTMEDVLPHLTEKARESMLEKRFAPEKAEKDFTLSPGQKRFPAEGGPSIAAVEEKPAKPWFESISELEVLARSAAEKFPGDESRQREWTLAEYQKRLEKRIEHKASTAFDWSKPTEAEAKSLDWIEGLGTFSSRFEEFTPEQLQAVTTIPGWLGSKWRTMTKGTLPGIFGPPGKAERTFAAINALMAEAEQLGFKLGGQQLTPMEKETVMAFVPNRADLINPVILQAKLKNLRTSLDIIKEMRLWRMRTPRGGLSVSVYDAALGHALKSGGVEPLTLETPTKNSGPGKWGG